MVKQLKSHKNKSRKYKKSKIYRKSKFSKKNLKGGKSNNTQLPIGFYWKQFHNGWNKITNFSISEYNDNVSMTTFNNRDIPDNIGDSFTTEMIITYDNRKDFITTFNNNDAFNGDKITQIEAYCEAQYGHNKYSWYGIGTKKIFYVETNDKITEPLTTLGFTKM